MNALHLSWVEFWELNMLFGSLVELLPCCIYLLVFFHLENLLFLQTRQLLNRSSTNSFLSSLSFSFLNRSSIDSQSIKEYTCALCLLHSISTAFWSIKIFGFLLDSFSIHQDFWVPVRHILDNFFNPSRHNFCALCLLDRFPIHRDILFAVDRSSIAPRQIHFCQDLNLDWFSIGTSIHQAAFSI